MAGFTPLTLRKEHCMSDEIKRELPVTWKDYLRDIGETISIVRWVMKELSAPKGKIWVWIMSVGMVVSIFAHVIQPKFIGEVSSGLVDRSIDAIFKGFKFFLVAITAQLIAEFIHASAREWILGLNSGRLDQRITELFFEKSVGQHIQEGTLLSVGNIDKGRWKVNDLQAMLLFEGVSSMIAMFFAYIFLWTLSWAAGLIMTGVIAGYMLWMLFLNQRVTKVCTPIDNEFRAVNRYRLERWEKAERVKVSAREDEEVDHLTNWFDKTMEKDRAFWLWFIKHTTLRGAMSTAGLAIIMIYGTWMIWKGAWGLGSLIPLYLWSSNLTSNLWRIGHVEHQLNWNMPAVRSMKNALTLTPDIVSKPNAVKLTSESTLAIEFRNVAHQYPAEPQENNGTATVEKKSNAILHNVSFTIKPGEKVALIGQSGAGKTTIMRLLLRFMDPTDGQILIDGVDLRDINLESWMRLVGYIPQQSQVFDGTIRDNMTYGLSAADREVITDDDVWAVMRQLKIDFEDRLTNGLDTLVGKNGLKLSGGQAQRLMIGAAAMKKPKFMIIDEATSSLDSSTEREVQKGLEQVLEKGIGALVIAHRLSTVRNLCDTFIVLRSTSSLNNGDTQIEAVGKTFEDLHVASPTFRKLAEDQGIVI